VTDNSPVLAYTMICLVPLYISRSKFGCRQIACVKV